MRLKNIAIGLDFTINAIFGGWPGESVSGRTWRLRREQPYKTLRPIIDWLFLWVEPNHCEKAYLHRDNYVPFDDLREPKK